MNQSTGYLVLAIFGIGWIALGVYWGRRAKDLDGFMLAGRNVGMALGTATAMATWVTSNTIMLAPVFALEKGIWGMLAYSTASFGLFLFAPMSARIRQLIPKGYTSGDFVRIRYGKIAWALFIIITMVYSFAWLASMAIAGGKVLNTLAGVPYETGMTIILLVCVIYTLFGGLYAVIGTDFIQSVIILIGVLVVGVLVAVKIDMNQIYVDITTTQPALFDMLMPVALLSLFNNMFFGFGEVFHNNVWWSRAFAMRGKVVSKAFWLSGILWFPIPIAAGFIALSAKSLGINIIDPNTVGPRVAAEVLGGAGAIVIFIVVFCSIASSIDSLLASTSDLLSEDVYKGMINRQVDERTLRFVTKLIIVALGIITWAICFNQERDLLSVLFFSGSLVASAIWPIISGLYWKSATSNGAIAAMILGSTIGLIAYFHIGGYVAPLISAIVSMVVVCISAKLSSRPFDWKTFQTTEAHP